MGIAHPGALSSGNFEFEVDWTGASYFSFGWIYLHSIKSPTGVVTNSNKQIRKSRILADANRRSNNNVTIDANYRKP